MGRALSRSIRTAWLVASFLPLSACAWPEPKRPASVPAVATRVGFSKEGGWAHCWLDADQHINRCRTYNAGGERLYRFGHEGDDDDVFLRDDGGAALADAELKISQFRTSPTHIWLDNGVVLLPRNAFEVNKELVDEIKAAMRKK
jgi:hypothetical protein